MTEPVTDEPARTDAPAPRWPLVVTGLLLIALGLIPTGNLLSDGVVVHHWGRNVVQWTFWLAVTSLLALLLARLGGAPLRTALASADRALLAPSSRVFAIVSAVAVTALAIAVGYAAFRLRPVSADELAQLWQARVLASGHLAARAPAHPEFFSTTMTVQSADRWFSQFPVGGAAALAFGLLVGAPWLVNPVLTGATAAALYYFVAAIDTERTARRATVLYALSPFVLLMGGSEMNHALVLAAVTTALAALPRWAGARDAGSGRGPAAVIGGALGVAATARPYDAVLCAMAIGTFQLVVLRARPALWRTILWQCVAGLLPVAILLVCNRMTTGAPLLFGYDLLNGPEHRPGFHLSPLWVDHTPERGLRMASSYLMTLDTALLAWPVPAVLLLATTLLLQRRATRWDLLLLGLFGAILVGYAAYWAESYFAGPRFLYCAIPCFILIIARFPTVVGERLRGTTTRTAVSLLVPLWLLLAWTLPPNRANAYGVRTLIRLNTEKGNDAAALVRAPKSPPRDILVFVPEGWRGRLTARLRRVGMRPLAAERLVSTADACAIQQALDALESAPDPSGDRTRRTIGELVHDAGGAPQPGLRPADQILLDPARPLTPICGAERARADSHGITMSELLPAMSVERDGRLGGAVIYARDLGVANERLRGEFGARRWLSAQVTADGDSIRVRVVPYVPGNVPSSTAVTAAR